MINALGLFPIVRAGGDESWGSNWADFGGFDFGGFDRDFGGFESYGFGGEHVRPSLERPEDRFSYERPEDHFIPERLDIPSKLSEQEALILANELGFGTGDSARGVSDAQVTQAAQHAIEGTLNKGDIAALNAAGLGSAEGFNIHNPTQSVAQMQAAQNVGSFIEKYIKPLIIGAVPGAAPAMALAQGIAGLQSGQATPQQFLQSLISPALAAAFPGSQAAIAAGQGITGLMSGQSFEQVAMNTALGAAARELGLPIGTMTAVLNGDFGKAAADTAIGAISGTLSKELGVPASLISAGLSDVGLTGNIRQVVSGDLFGTSSDSILPATPSIETYAQREPIITTTLRDAGMRETEPNLPAPTGTTTSTAAPKTSANNSAGLFALGTMMAPQQQKPQQQYQTARTVASPFGMDLIL